MWEIRSCNICELPPFHHSNNFNSKLFKHVLTFSLYDIEITSKPTLMNDSNFQNFSATRLIRMKNDKKQKTERKKKKSGNMWGGHMKTEQCLNINGGMCLEQSFTWLLALLPKSFLITITIPLFLALFSPIFRKAIKDSSF